MLHNGKGRRPGAVSCAPLRGLGGGAGFGAPLFFQLTASFAHDPGALSALQQTVQGASECRWKACQMSKLRRPLCVSDSRATRIQLSHAFRGSRLTANRTTRRANASKSDGTAAP